MWRIKTFLIKGLISILIVIIPIIVFCILILFQNINLLKSNIDKIQMENLKKAVQEVNYFLDQIKNYSLSSYISIEEIFEGGSSEAEIPAYLHQLSIEPQSDINFDAFCYFPGDKYIYTKQGKVWYYNFENMYGGLDLSFSYFFTTINTARVPMMFRIKNRLDAQVEDGAIVYLYPYKRESGGFCIGYIIKLEAFKDIFINYLGEIDGNMYIYDRNLKTLFSNDIRENTGAFQREIFRIKGVGIIKQIIQGNSYVIMREVLPFEGLTYIVLMTTKIFYRAADRNTRTMIFLGISLVLICVTLAFLFSRFNYRPMKYLIEEIRDKDPSVPETNEIDIIRFYIQKTRDTANSLSRQLLGQRPVFESQFVLLMIGGKIQEHNALLYYSRFLNIEFDYSYWAAIVLTIQASNQKDTILKKILKAGRDCVLPNAVLICSELIHEEGICYVLNFSGGNESPELALNVFAQSLYQCIRSKGFGSICFGVGKCYNDHKMVKRSFYEATAANRMIIGMDSDSGPDKGIKVYRDSDDEKKNKYLLPPMVKFLLIEGLRHGDRQAALAALDDIIRYIDSDSISYLHMRFLCDDLLHLLFEIAEQLNVHLSQNLVLPILTFNSCMQFREVFALIIQDLCVIFQKNNAKAQNEKLYTPILICIEKNYTNPLFSLEYVSDTLGISKLKISAVVKDTFGCGFAQYIAFLRMNEVKRLLVESERDVQDIVRSVGYLDLPNFLRKFKQLEGLTPGQYRKVKKMEGKIPGNDSSLSPVAAAQRID
jgi:AraC-like DNA-binding protein